MPQTSEIVNFIRANFPTLWAIDQFLLMREKPVVSWSVEDLIRSLRSSRLIVMSNLALLMEKGFVVASEGGRYAYRPGSDEIEAMCAELARFCKDRPLMTIQALTGPARTMRSLVHDFESWRDGSCAE